MYYLLIIILCIIIAGPDLRFDLVVGGSGSAGALIIIASTYKEVMVNIDYKIFLTRLIQIKSIT